MDKSKFSQDALDAEIIFLDGCGIQIQIAEPGSEYIQHYDYPEKAAADFALICAGANPAKDGWGYDIIPVHRETTISWFWREVDTHGSVEILPGVRLVKRSLVRSELPRMEGAGNAWVENLFRFKYWIIQAGAEPYGVNGAGDLLNAMPADWIPEDSFLCKEKCDDDSLFLKVSDFRDGIPEQVLNLEEGAEFAEALLKAWQDSAEDMQGESA